MFHESDQDCILDCDRGGQYSWEDQSAMENDASRSKWTSSSDRTHRSAITVDHVIDKFAL